MGFEPMTSATDTSALLDQLSYQAQWELVIFLDFLAIVIILMAATGHINQNLF